MGLPVVLGVYPHAPDKLCPCLLLLVTGLGFGVHLAGLRGLTRPLLGVSLVLPRAADGKIPNMTNTRLHNIVISQILVDGLGLGGRLHNNQTFTHNGGIILADFLKPMP